MQAVKSVLAQRGVSVECIVLDDAPDASARDAIATIGDERVRYIARNEPSGGRPALVRNQGAALAQGRYLHFLDDDDLLADEALRDLVHALERRRDCGVAVGWVVPFGDDLRWLNDKVQYFTRAARVAASTKNSLWTVAHVLFRGTLFVNSACMIRREFFEPLGGFDPSIPVYEDVDFWMRAIRRYGHVYVDRPVLHYRTGRPSLMHALGDDTSLVHESNTMIHQKYRKEHGELEYRLLQACTKLLPFSLVRRIPVSV